MDPDICRLDFYSAPNLHARQSERPLTPSQQSTDNYRRRQDRRACHRGRPIPYLPSRAVWNERTSHRMLDIRQTLTPAGVDRDDSTIRAAATRSYDLFHQGLVTRIKTIRMTRKVNNRVRTTQGRDLLITALPNS